MLRTRHILIIVIVKFYHYLLERKPTMVVLSWKDFLEKLSFLRIIWWGVMWWRARDKCPQTLHRTSLANIKYWMCLLIKVITNCTQQHSPKKQNQWKDIYPLVDAEKKEREKLIIGTGLRFWRLRNSTVVIGGCLPCDLYSFCQFKCNLFQKHSHRYTQTWCFTSYLDIL